MRSHHCRVLVWLVLPVLVLLGWGLMDQALARTVVATGYAVPSTPTTVTANSSKSTLGANASPTVTRSMTAWPRVLPTGEVPADLAGFVAADSGIGIDESISGSISAQRQARHVLDSPLYNGGGYFKDASDAQCVLDAYHSGDASILQTTSNGNVIVRYRGVTGYNNNPGAGYLNQSTDVFMIKGTKSVSVVPISPGG